MTPSRRAFLRLAGAGLSAAALAACGVEGDEDGDDPPPAAGTPEAATLAGPVPQVAAEPVAATPVATATPVPTPVPRPVPSAGVHERLLLPGTPYETPLVAHHSGVEGPIVIVLGGVHGNEPGGWVAAEAIASWRVERGALLVVPRANRLATRAMERTLPELGDLNRMYPGAADGLPMAAMALEITSVAREYRADWLIDMHESWGFLAEYETRGTAFIGQTVTNGGTEAARGLLAAAVERTNAQITAREQLVFRGRRGQNANPSSMSPARVGTSSLSMGVHVPGLEPVLVEMGQERQPVERRAELHRMFVREVLTGLEMGGRELT